MDDSKKKLDILKSKLIKKLLSEYMKQKENEEKELNLKIQKSFIRING